MSSEDKIYTLDLRFRTSEWYSNVLLDLQKCLKSLGQVGGSGGLCDFTVSQSPKSLSPFRLQTWTWI